MYTEYIHQNTKTSISAPRVIMPRWEIMDDSEEGNGSGDWTLGLHTQLHPQPFSSFEKHLTNSIHCPHGLTLAIFLPGSQSAEITGMHLLTQL